MLWGGWVLTGICITFILYWGAAALDRVWCCGWGRRFGHGGNGSGSCLAPAAELIVQDGCRLSEGRVGWVLP
jgi:hypothetical protein